MMSTWCTFFFWGVLLKNYSAHADVCVYISLLLDLTAYNPGITGASVTVEDFEGRSALSIAEESGLPKMREVLYSYI